MSSSSEPLQKDNETAELVTMTDNLTLANSTSASTPLSEAALLEQLKVKCDF